MSEMTPAEIAQEMRAIEKAVGPRSNLFVTVSTDKYREGILRCSVYPMGMAHDSAFIVFSNDWADLFSQVRAKWAEHSDQYRKSIVRKMALTIIRLTAEDGVCTDAALRGSEFTAGEIAEFGAEAIEDANQIASSGPFSITKLAGANAA